MPETPVYGFPLESLTESEPTETLNGGSDGTKPKLGQKVEDELLRVEDDVQDVADAAAAAALGWHPIGSGTASDVSAFVIDATMGGTWPAGTFSMMRLVLRGQMRNSAQYVTLNINDSLTSDSHLRGWIRKIASTGEVDDSGGGEASTWRIGYWSSVFLGNYCEVLLLSTDVSSQVTFEATGGQQSTTAATHRKFEGWGRLQENRLVSSLRVGRVGTEDLGPTRWWLEGWRDV